MTRCGILTCLWLLWEDVLVGPSVRSARSQEYGDVVVARIQQIYALASLEHGSNWFCGWLLLRGWLRRVYTQKVDGSTSFFLPPSFIRPCMIKAGPAVITMVLACAVEHLYTPAEEASARSAFWCCAGGAMRLVGINSLSSLTLLLLAYWCYHPSPYHPSPRRPYCRVNRCLPDMCVCCDVDSGNVLSNQNRRRPCTVDR